MKRMKEAGPLAATADVTPYYVRPRPRLEPVASGPAFDLQRSFSSSFHYCERKFKQLSRRVKETSRVRIFLSSPFDGCEPERVQFLKNSLQKIKQECAKAGIDVSFVDMRWGINDAVKSRNEALDICLRALDSSDIMLGYFGARYGSTAKNPDHARWLLPSIKRAEWNHSYLSAYKDRSVTELEWLHACLHPDFATLETKPLCFFFYRSAAFDNSELLKAQARVISVGDEVHLFDPTKGDWCDWPVWTVAVIHAGQADVLEVTNASGDRKRVPLLQARLKLVKYYEPDYPDMAADLRERVRAVCASEENRSASVFEDYPTPRDGESLMSLCLLGPDGVVTRLLKQLAAESSQVLSDYRRPHQAHARLRASMRLQFDEAVEDEILAYIEGPTTVVMDSIGGGSKTTQPHPTYS